MNPTFVKVFMSVFNKYDETNRKKSQINKKSEKLLQDTSLLTTVSTLLHYFRFVLKFPFFIYCKNNFYKTRFI